MTPTIRRKLEQLAERHEELEHLLASPEVLADQNRFRELSREHAQLAPLTATLASYDEADAAMKAAKAMLSDPEMVELAGDEIDAQQARLEELDHELNLHLLPKDPRDDGNLFLEVRDDLRFQDTD